jgi:phage terminase large subunit
MSYQIHAGEGQTDTVYTPYGGCAEFMYCKEPEFIAEGPAETGKTLAACWKIHMLALKYPGLNGAIVRKTQSSIYGSVLQTFQRVIDGAPVEPYGGAKPERYIYENGSTIWIGGMDNADRILSSERDFFYVNQAEELKLDDWEKMTTRTTGRGAIMPYTMTFGDCNPGGSRHWIRDRAKAGLKLIRTTHRDNPTLFDPVTGEITAQGERSLYQLEQLTGVRRKRLLEGIWATSEGAVYDMFDAAVHVKAQDPGKYKRWYLGIDEGYTNPAVILLIGEDSDGRHHIHHELYERGKLQEWIVARAGEWYTEFGCSFAAVDAAAAGLIADMRNNGMNARGSKGRVKDRIDAVQNRLSVQGDDLPRLTIDPSCVGTINDFESRVWKPEKDEPVKADDHGTDAYEYLELLTRRKATINPRATTTNYIRGEERVENRINF